MYDLRFLWLVFIRAIFFYSIQKQISCFCVGLWLLDFLHKCFLDLLLSLSLMFVFLRLSIRKKDREQVRKTDHYHEAITKQAGSLCYSFASAITFEKPNNLNFVRLRPYIVKNSVDLH